VETSARPTFPAADTDREVHRSPPEVLAALSGVLDEPHLNGWPNVVRDIGALTIAGRAAIEPQILVLIGRFATANPSLVNGSTLDSPFFDLLAALDGEFDWAGRDRAIYTALGTVPADDLVGVLDWVREERSASGRQTPLERRGPRLPPISRRDVHSFFNDGKDAAALKAYRRFLQEPKLWRGSDALALLFFPFPALASRNYAKAALGFFGWTAFAVLFFPQTLPVSSIVLPAALSACLLSDFIVYAVRLGPRLRKASPASDQSALIWFPGWALMRGLPVHAAIGFVAWGGFLFRAGADDPGSMSFGAKADLLLITTLHVMACVHGRRWVIERLIRAVWSADRKGIVDPERRARYLRARATRPRRIVRGIVLVTGFAAIVAAIFESGLPGPASIIITFLLAVPTLQKLGWLRLVGQTSLRFWRNPRSSA
jgi:hypothetical protein